MNRNILFIIVAIIGVFILVTQTDLFSDADSIGSINGQSVSENKFNAYLKFKRIQVKTDEHRAELVKQYLEREALMRMAASQENLDKDLLEAEINDFKQQMYISRYFEQYLKDVVTDQAVQNYYVANAKDYEHKQAHVAHILFRVNKSMNENERAAKQTTAQDVYSKLKAGGVFEKLATDYSDDKHSAKKGGDLGWLKEGAINKQFSDKAFSLEQGQITEPFETPFGFHIVKLIEPPKTVKKPFEAVKGDIRYKLRQKAKAAEISKLRSAASIKVKGH